VTAVAYALLSAIVRRISVSDDAYDEGLKIRKSVLGDEYVNRALANVNSFNAPLQELVTEYCWGKVWGRPGLDRRQRSMLNLAMISILNRPHELKAHIRGALTNGLTPTEIREVFLQVMIYAGVPAAVDSFRIANETFVELGVAIPKED
jgi:4-carboxymuconolactone decarboxylase